MKNKNKKYMKGITVTLENYDEYSYLMIPLGITKNHMKKMTHHYENIGFPNYGYFIPQGKK